MEQEKEKNQENQGGGFLNFTSAVTYRTVKPVKMHRELIRLQSFFFKADFVLH